MKWSKRMKRGALDISSIKLLRGILFLLRVANGSIEWISLNPLDTVDAAGWRLDGGWIAANLELNLPIELF